MPATGWYPDPTRRHRYRWWSGRWTWQVTDGGASWVDPLRPPRRIALGAVLLLQPGLIPLVLFWFIGGDPDCTQPARAVTPCPGTDEPPWGALGGLVAAQLVAAALGLALLLTPRYRPPAG